MISKLEAIKQLLLHEWDPIGVAGVNKAMDEYDSYAMQIFSMLNKGSDEEVITQYLHEVVTERMGLRGNLEFDRKIAAKAIVMHLDNAEKSG